MSRLILLAAGMGRRMRGVADDLPKPLLRLPSGRTVIGETLRNAFSSGAVDRATVVTGYRARLVERAVVYGRPEGLVDTALNPFYAAAGPLGSIWAVRGLLQTEDVIIGNGDTVFAEEVFRALGADRALPVALAYSRRPTVADDVKVVLNGDASVVRVGKGIEDGEASGVSAGLLSVRGEEARAALVRCLDDYMRGGDGAGPRAIWHDLVNRLANGGGGVHAVQVRASLWHEVDTASDYESLVERHYREALTRR